MTLSFVDCQIYQEIKQFFKRAVFDKKFQKKSHYSIIVMVSHTFEGISGILNPGIQHRAQNSKQINITKYVSKFLIYGTKVLDKCVKSQK